MDHELHGGQADPPANIPRLRVELGGVAHPEQVLHGTGGDAGAVVLNGEHQILPNQMLLHPDGSGAPAALDSLGGVHHQIFQDGHEAVVLLGGEVGLIVALNGDLFPLFSQDVSHGILEDVEQVGDPHLLVVVGPGAGHLALDAPDDAQVVLFHLVDVPGNGQGQGTQLTALPFLLPQPLIEAVCVGHHLFNVVGVLF